MNKKEIRAFNFEVRAEETERGNMLTGMPIVYNERTDLGWYDEIIDTGALDNTCINDLVIPTKVGMTRSLIQVRLITPICVMCVSWLTITLT